ncbi:MAG: DNA-directed RNA polymerase subunit alpha [Candidatus Gastranaerophilales bacterium]|nr:DNA-directed RNA polymerase subunit alpha [Candidatus Gastranaerophilales bacterium]
MDLKIKCINSTTSSDGSMYGKFVMEPLERGFGTTIGNSLRRVLLSSLEGAAVSAVRIEGVTHEYTSIPGIEEDVIDIILNLKSLVVKSEFKEPQTLRIDVDKSGPILASDIQLPAGVKVINPDWLIATVSEGGSFHADIIIETGKGYVTAEAMTELNGIASIDMLPIDASFMPIKKVSYSVENTRVGQNIDYDKLTLEIWSNGSVDVSTALTDASNILIEHFVAVSGFAGAPLPNLVSSSNAIIEDENQEDDQAVSITIEDLELSVRAYNCLKRASINSMAELMKKSEHDLLNIKNFGKKSSDEVIEKLRAFGLDLAPNPEGVELGE